MRAAFLRIDVIYKAIDIFHIAVIVLQRNLNDCIILGAIEIDRLRIDFFLFAVQMLDEGTDTAIKMESLLMARALIIQRNRNALVQESQLTQPMLERIEAVDRRRENIRVRQEMYLGTGFLRIADDLQRALGGAAGKRNRMDLAIALDLNIHERAQSVYDRNTNAMQAAGYLIAIAAELTARMQHGQNNLNSRLAAFVHINRDTAPIIDNSDAVILMNGHVYIRTVASQGLINGVVDNLIDEMMQAAL